MRKMGELGSKKREKNLVLEGRKAVVMWGFHPRKESTQQYSSLALVSVYFFHISTPFCEGNPVGCRYSPIPTIMKIILFCYFRVENAKKIRLSLNNLPLNFLQ